MALVDRVPQGIAAATLRAVTAMPAFLRRAMAGRPIRLDGQQLALDAQLLTRLQRASGTSVVGSPDAATARRHLEAAAAIAGGTPHRSVSARDLSIPAPHGSLPARLYRPGPRTEGGPLLVYFHGGAFALGSLDTHDAAVRFLATHAEMPVLSVAYRLAPEHPLPAGVEDALTAFDYAHAHATELGVDPRRIAVGGDSAGGNLAAVVAQQAVKRGAATPVFQLLLYPKTDFATTYPSRELFAKGFFLTDSDIRWSDRSYIPEGTDLTDPRLSPLYADDLSGLPSAHIVTAGFDPLRDEGEAYAHALEKAGVPVVLRREPDLIHGFVSFLGFGDRFREATLEVATTLRVCLDH